MKHPSFASVALGAAATTALISPIASTSPSTSTHHHHYHHQSPPGTPFLNFSTPSPHIFTSLTSLLSQWPNTLFPNGHTIAAVTLPKHTLLYHGRHDQNSTPSPEWLSFDVEMAYAIMGNLPDSRLLTYRTARPVKALYFDGMSAALMGTGMEAQMAFLYGDSESVPDRPFPGRPGGPGRGRGPPGGGGGGGERPDFEDDAADERPRPPGRGGPGFGGWNPLEDEYFRAEGLCNWVKERKLGGRGWGFEGVVRMNAAFELIWCDFESPSLPLVSNINVSAPRMELSERRRSEKRNVNVRNPGRPMGEQNVMENPSNQHVLADTPEGPHGPGMTDPSEPFRGISNWMWFTAATRRYGSTGMQSAGPGRGESRARIEPCGIFTFYDPALAGQDTARVTEEQASLNISATGEWRGPEDEREREAALEQLMRRRRTHRTNHVSKADGAFMWSAVEQRLQNTLRNELEDKTSPQSCSGIDWQLTAQEIVTFYATNLRNLLDLLSQHDEITSAAGSDYLAVRGWLASVRDLTHWFVLPHFEYPDRPYSNESIAQDFTLNSTAVREGVARCKEQYSPVPDEELASGEPVLAWAVEEVLDGICRTVFSVGMSVEREWLVKFNRVPEEEEWRQQEREEELSSAAAVMAEAKSWKRSVEELMAWLGWAEQWTGCEGPCAANELCYIPIWPVGGFPGPGGRRPGGRPGGRPVKESDERRPGPPGGPPGGGSGGPGWGGDSEEYLWHPVCVNASAYPP